jgi:hypothetical protein
VRSKLNTLLADNKLILFSAIVYFPVSRVLYIGDGYFFYKRYKKVMSLSSHPIPTHPIKNVKKGKTASINKDKNCT